MWCRVSLSALSLILLFAQLPSTAQSSPPNALPFFKNYFITGDYRVGSVDLADPVGDFVTGDIHFNAALGNVVPANADIVAAFLYWEMITLEHAPPNLSGARFRDEDIGTIAKQLGPAKRLTKETSPCWAGAEGDVFELRGYRADVLRFLHVPSDANGNATGKRLVNDVDYAAAAAIDPSVVPLRVRLPDASGNHVPSSSGASLMVIYKDQDPAKPLKSVIIYNGTYAQAQDPATHIIETMTQRIGGFYQLAASPEARMTHLVGRGAGNSTERLWVGNDELSLFQIAANPFPGAGSASSDRAWGGHTFSLSIPGADGEYAMKVDHGSNSPYDCLSWLAIVSSAIVEDTDKDGLLNQWETDGRYQKVIYDSAGNVTNALFGRCTDASFVSDPASCVDFPKMGALPLRKDIFIEFGYMHALAGTTYGISAPKGGAAHHHRPDPEALQMVGKAFDNAPVAIKVHFDLGDDYPSGTVAEPYLIRDAPSADLARGGEAIVETACDPLENPVTCVFFGYPGTVPWKTGFRFLRDESLSHRKSVGGVDKGPDEAACVAAETDSLESTTCVRRFDSNRKDTFRYGLWAHALGSPRVDDLGVPLLDSGSYIPRNISGVADGGGSGGGDFMITLGAFGSDVGNESVQAQASTLMHELGHTIRLRHGSVVEGDGFISKPEANCRPHYQSVMNYLYQIRGLIVDTGPLAGTPAIDYSRQALRVPAPAPSGPKLSENSLTEAPGSGLKDGAAFSPYRARWFSPTSLNPGQSDPVTRHCDGTRFTQSEIDAGVTMFAIDGTRAAGPVDWNANGIADAGTYSQDINFNRGPNLVLTPATATDGPFSGFNDWANIDLRQVGSRRNVVSSGLGGAMSLDMGLGDFGLGDFGLGDFGLGDFGLGDFGLGDFGLGDFGLGDFGLGDFGQGAPELDLETALGAVGGGAPNALAATLTGRDVRLRWASPPVSEVATYEVFRVVGPSADFPVAIRSADLANATRIGTVAAPLTELVDTGVQPRGRTYAYFVIAVSVEGVRSPQSNLAVILVP